VKKKRPYTAYRTTYRVVWFAILHGFVLKLRGWDVELCELPDGRTLLYACWWWRR